MYVASRLMWNSEKLLTMSCSSGSQEVQEVTEVMPVMATDVSVLEVMEVEVGLQALHSRHRCLMVPLT